MKTVLLLAAAITVISNPVFAGDVLTGRTKLSCEANLCLPSPTQPSECNPALNEYYSINGKHKASKRRKFLALCPKQDVPAAMKEITDQLDQESKNESNE